MSTGSSPASSPPTLSLLSGSHGQSDTSNAVSADDHSPASRSKLHMAASEGAVSFLSPRSHIESIRRTADLLVDDDAHSDHESHYQAAGIQPPTKKSVNFLGVDPLSPIHSTSNKSTPGTSTTVSAVPTPFMSPKSGSASPKFSGFRNSRKVSRSTSFETISHVESNESFVNYNPSYLHVFGYRIRMLCHWHCRDDEMLFDEIDQHHRSHNKLPEGVEPRKEEKSNKHVCRCCRHCTCTQARALFILSCVFIVFGAVSFLVAIFVPPMLDDYVDGQADQSILLLNDQAPAYLRFIDNRQSSSPQYMQYYLFNIPNTVEVVAGSAYPFLQEKGPYVFRQYTVRFNNSFSADNCELTSTTWNYYVYESGPSLDEQITTLNMAFLMLSGLAKSSLLYWAAFRLLYGPLQDSPAEQLFVTATARDLLLGYVDPYLNASFAKIPGIGISSSYASVPGILTNYTDIDSAAAEKLSDTLKTGACNKDETRVYVQYQNSSTLRYCSGETNSLKNCNDPFLPMWQDSNTSDANVVTGTDAGQFKRKLSPTDSLKAFIQLRSVDLLNYDDEGISFKDIPLLRFRVPDDQFYNATLNPINADYYQFVYNGAFNLSKSQKFLNVYATKPHFLGTDASDPLRTGVDGLDPPDREKHDSIFDIEPFTGSVMHGGLRLQTNVQIGPIGTPDYLHDVKSTVCPYYWVDASGEISDEEAASFRSDIQVWRQMSSFIVHFGFALASALTCFSLVFGLCGLRAVHMKRNIKKKRRKDKLGNDAEAMARWRHRLLHEKKKYEQEKRATDKSSNGNGTTAITPTNATESILAKAAATGNADKKDHVESKCPTGVENSERKQKLTEKTGLLSGAMSYSSLQSSSPSSASSSSSALHNSGSSFFSGSSSVLASANTQSDLKITNSASAAVADRRKLNISMDERLMWIED